MAKRSAPTGKPKTEKKVTRYTYDHIKEPRTPETGHTPLLPAEEQVVTLPMDNGWSKAIHVGKLPEGDERPVVVDMDPAADPVLFWAGKRNRREVPVLPLQRNEIVSESRIAQIIERARRAAEEQSGAARQGHLFADLEKTLRETDRKKRVEFYTHEEGWKNKLICGDSLHVMESLLHYENLRGKVQMIYIDPPYGIKYDSNFQQRVDSTTNDEKDAADDVLTIKAFRDTWALGIHSYLSYLQERLYLCRELLAESGSVFVQISDDNVHLVRALLDEVMGKANFCSLISFNKTTGQTSRLVPTVSDYLLWYAKDIGQVKFRPMLLRKEFGGIGSVEYTNVELPDGTIRRIEDEEIDDPSRLPPGARVFATGDITADGWSESGSRDIRLPNKITLKCGPNLHWKVSSEGILRLYEKKRLLPREGHRIYKRYYDDFPYMPLSNVWTDVRGEPGKKYVVQTSATVVTRCLLMTTDPGDLVFDPTCGSGTTAYSAERWGRRWITCDTSRVAVNVARKRLLSAVYDHYVTRNGKITSSFVLETADRVTMSSLAYDREPEKVELVDQPEVDKDAIRVCGPFEVMSLGRYSVEDWKGYVVREAPAAYGEPAKLENYIEVICRLYRKDAAIQGASGLVHAVAETEQEKIAISVGPLSGRVTAKQINDAVQDALASGILEVHVLGWAFEANVGEVKSALEKRGKLKVELIMIRPDTLAEGLKATQPEMLFSPLALPDIEVAAVKNGKDKQLRVTLKGVALFDRKRRTTEYKQADSGYVSAWYLDEDYDGDCFVDCQMFFDFKRTPNIKAALKAEVDPDEFTLKLTSEPFPVRGYKRIAVKVVDVYGNESVVVRDLGEA
jgi:adenine-specific DNA-methyltransferase